MNLKVNLYIIILVSFVSCQDKKETELEYSNSSSMETIDPTLPHTNTVDHKTEQNIDNKMIKAPSHTMNYLSKSIIYEFYEVDLSQTAIIKDSYKKQQDEVNSLKSTLKNRLDTYAIEEEVEVKKLNMLIEQHRLKEQSLSNYINKNEQVIDDLVTLNNKRRKFLNNKTEESSQNLAKVEQQIVELSKSGVIFKVANDKKEIMDLEGKIQDLELANNKKEEKLAADIEKLNLTITQNNQELLKLQNELNRYNFYKEYNLKRKDLIEAGEFSFEKLQGLLKEKLAFIEAFEPQDILTNQSYFEILKTISEIKGPSADQVTLLLVNGKNIKLKSIIKNNSLNEVVQKERLQKLIFDHKYTVYNILHFLYIDIMSALILNKSEIKRICMEYHDELQISENLSPIGSQMSIQINELESLLKSNFLIY